MVSWTRWSVSTLVLTQVGHNHVLTEFRLGNPAKAYVLATKGNNLKEDHRFAKFFEVSDADFDLDVEGEKIVREV